MWLRKKRNNCIIKVKWSNNYLYKNMPQIITMTKTDNKFPNIKDVCRLKILRKWERLYDGEHYKEFGIKDYFVDCQKIEKELYIAINLPSLVSEYFADLVSSEDITIIASEEKEQEFYDNFKVEQQLNDKAYEIALDQSIYGFSVVKLRTDDDEVFMDIVPPMQYYPNLSKVDAYGNPTEKILASYLVIDNVNYLYKEIHTIDPAVENSGHIEWELWRLSKSLKPIEKVDVSLVKDDGIDSQDTGLNFIPIFQINNLKTSKQDFGKSDYKDAQNLYQELNDRTTQISVQLIKHMNAKLGVPNGILDENGEIKVKDLDAIEFNDEGQKPIYITNDNPQIDNGFKQIDKLLRFIASISKIPPEELGLEGKGGAEKVEAIKIRLFNSIRKAQRKRMQLTTGLTDILMSALIMSGESTDPSTPKIVYDDFLPVDDRLQTTLIIERLNAGLISRETAIRRLENIEVEAAQAELDKIKQEEAQNQFSLNTPTPRITEL